MKSWRIKWRNEREIETVTGETWERAFRAAGYHEEHLYYIERVTPV